ncbi:MAG: ribosome recycling factor [Candidatus Omnitrophica bacterium]|nr:ribosome recycling factor [Candidatus Omnitrophota bacterium]
MWNEVVTETKQKMQRATESSREELTKIRSGRANPSIIETIRADYYGAMTPIKQLATISAPESRMLIVQPFDASAVAEISKAIQTADLGLTPQIEGKMIRVPVPALTKERREELIKVVKKVAEDGRVTVRTVRRDANDKIKKLEKDKKITEDDRESALERIQKETDAAIKHIDDIAKNKEEELSNI